MKRMKKLLCAFMTAIMLCAMSLPFTAGAEDVVSLYWSDGRMATVPVSMADQCRADGWQDNFPYYGKTIWIRKEYLWWAGKDIYGTDAYQLLSYADMPTFLQATIVWYDDQDFEVLGGYQKQLKTLIIDYNGSQYKIPMGDFLRGREDYIDWQEIYWEDPKATNGVSDASWERIQRGEYWVGMPKNEFLLCTGPAPDYINYYNYGYGTTEQWVYEHSTSPTNYYYFRNGVLSSWQVTK